MFDKAKWIWSRCETVQNEYNDFIQEFEIFDLTKKIVLHISSDTNYIAYINGKIVDFGQYHDLPENKVYDTLELSNFLEVGLNRLCIIGYSHNEPSQSYIKAVPSLIFEVVCEGEIIVSSGQSTLSRLSMDFFSGELYKFSGQLGYASRYFADRYDGWLESGCEGFDCSVVIDRQCTFSPRPISKLVCSERLCAQMITQGRFRYRENEKNIAYAMQHSYMSQCELSSIASYDYKVTLPLEGDVGVRFKNSETIEKSDGIYLIFDLKKESAGILDISIEAMQGTKIDIGYGEHLEDMRVRSMITDRCFAMEIVAKEGRTEFVNYFKRIGCRYLQLFVHASSFTLFRCNLISTDYPVQITNYDGLSFFQTKIYETCLQTLRLCMHEHYEDCPWREQALYSFDSRNQILCGYETFNEVKMPRASLLLLAHSLRADGHLELCSPCRMPLTIPMFTLTFVLEVYEYMEKTKDLDFLEEVFPIVEKIISTFLSKMDGGAIPAFVEPQYWNFYEWNEGLNGMPLSRTYTLDFRYDAGLNAFMVIALDRYCKLIKEYNLEVITDDIEKSVCSIKQFVNEHFYNASKGIYRAYYLSNNDEIYAEFINYALLYAGIVPEKQRGHVIEKLLENSNDVIKSTLSPMMYKYQVLLDCSVEKYLPFILKDIESIWGKMLFEGATTFWETERGADDFYFAGSLCHGWSAVPAYIYKKYIMKCHQ